VTAVPTAVVVLVYPSGEMAYSSRFPTQNRPRRLGRSRLSRLRLGRPRTRGAFSRRRGRGRRFSFAPSPDLVLVVLASLVIGGPSFLYVWQGAKLQQLTAEREAARAELTQLEEINHSLELQIEEGFSLQRLSRYAIGQLGMAPPTEVRYVHVPKSDLP